MTESATAAASSLRSKAALVGLIFVFAAPLLAAVLFYRFAGWLPLPEPDSHGNLVSPAHTFERFNLTGLGGKRFGIRYLKGKWTLIYAGGSRCDLWCQAALFKMRQVRLTLGKNQARVQRLYVITGSEALPGLRPLMHRDSGMMVATPRQDSRGMMLDALRPRPSGTFFLVDPHANLILRYPPDTTSEGLKQDLSRLLKASQIG